MKVAVTGSSGFIGSALIASLRDDGHDVVRFVRRDPTGAGEARWDPVGGHIDRVALGGTSAVVHLAGESIGARRWSRAEKARLVESRVAGTKLISATLAEVQPDAVLVSASAVGYYGVCGDEVLTESSPAGAGFLASLCVAWEQATAPASDAGMRVVRLRTGIVLGREGALGRMLPLFRLGLGGRLGSGKQWWSWIALADAVGLIRHAITTSSLTGPMNVTSPNPARFADVARALGRVLHRPTVLPVPALALGLVMGREMTREVILASQRALPEVAQQSGYQFQHTDLDAALAASLARTA